MTCASQHGRSRALLALPVVCCVGHVVLIAAGAGSLAAVTGAVTGSVPVSLAALLLLAAVGTGVLLRRPRRPAAAAGLPDPAVRVRVGGAR